MRLSEAMRLGVMVAGQARRTLYDEGDETACALGGALIAVGTPRRRIANRARSGFAVNHWPILMWRCDPAALPRCAVAWRAETYSVRDVIENLNDLALWPVESIALWIEEVEQEYERRAQGYGVPEAKIRHILGDDGEAVDREASREAERERPALAGEVTHAR